MATFLQVNTRLYMYVYIYSLNITVIQLQCVSESSTCMRQQLDGEVGGITTNLLFAACGLVAGVDPASEEMALATKNTRVMTKRNPTVNTAPAMLPSMVRSWAQYYSSGCFFTFFSRRFVQELKPKFKTKCP